MILFACSWENTVLQMSPFKHAFSIHFKGVSRRNRGTVLSHGLCLTLLHIFLLWCTPFTTAKQQERPCKLFGATSFFSKVNCFAVDYTFVLVSLSLMQFITFHVSGLIFASRDYISLLIESHCGTLGTSGDFCTDSWRQGWSFPGLYHKRTQLREKGCL